MNGFKNAIACLECKIEILKDKLDFESLTVEQELKILNQIRELKVAILTLQSSVDLLNIGSIVAINQLQK